MAANTDLVVLNTFVNIARGRLRAVGIYRG